MCNLFQTASSADLIAKAFPGRLRDMTGNEPWQTDVYPDRLAPIIRHDRDGLVIAKARWGMPNADRRKSASGRDKPLTNVRHTTSPHWQRWLGPEHRCLVPLERFAEPVPGGNQWFAAADAGATMFFAGIEVRQWTSIRKVKDGETTDDLFAFLTTEANAEVKPVHRLAMPVILTKPEEWEAWLTLPWDQAQALQRPLPDGTLRLV